MVPLGDELGGVGVHLLQPDTVTVYLGLDVAVGRAAHTHADGAGGSMTGQTHHTDVVGKGLAAKLGAKSYLLGFLEQFLLQVDVAEGTSGLITGGGQTVVILDTGQFYGEQVLLGRCTADDEGDMVGRTGCGTQTLHLLHQEGQQGAFVLDGGLGHGVEVGLVGRSAAFGYHHKAVFGSLAGLDVDLCRKVAAGVHLVVHVEGSILRVTQIVVHEGVVYTARKGFLVLKAGPHLLAFLTMYNGGAGVLAEGQNALAGCFGVAKELQGHIAVVF